MAFTCFMNGKFYCAEFINPFDMNAKSKLEDHRSFFCALACMHVIQTTAGVIVLNVVQPIPFLKPR